MAINYFDQLGFGAAMNRPFEVAQQLSSLQNQALNRDVMRQEQARQNQMQQAEVSAFQDAKMRERTANASGLIYSALSSGQPERAAQLAAQFESDFKRLDPTFSATQFAQMVSTPEGLQQLTQETLTLSQIMAGPEQMARFVAEQARPEKTTEATAQIKNTAEYRRYTDAIRQAVASGDKDLAKELIAERDFFVNQVDPYARSFASEQGAGQARVATEAALTPEMVERTRQQEAAKLKEQSDIKAAESSRKNQTAFNAYETAARAVGELSGNATSGVFGLAPAVMADDRLFEGAIAIMRPAIKDVVRGAGEGTFTDADQALMNQMLPSRVDSPDVRAAKLQMLDNFIRAKLGQSPAQQAQPQSVPMSNAAPMQRNEQPSAQGLRLGRFIIEVE